MTRGVGSRLAGPRATALTLVGVLVWVAAAVDPSDAAAADLFPVDDIVGDVIGGGADFVAAQVAGGAVAALLGIIKFLVGDLDESFGRQVVHLLLGLPDYTHPEHRALNRYAEYVQAIGWALLGLTFVGSALRYWAAGYGAGSAGDALRAFQSAAGAAAGLVALEPVWHFATVGINRLTWALASGPGVGDRADDLFVGALTAGLSEGTVTPFGGLVVIVSLGCVVWLLVTKVVLAAVLAILYLAAPLAIALSPLREDLGWLTDGAVRGTLAVLAWPVIWALCFAVFALVGLDAYTGQNPGANGALGKVIQPLVAVAALLAAIKLPKAVLDRALGAPVSPTARGALQTVALVGRLRPGSAR